jgi:hypothetical protein
VESYLIPLHLGGIMTHFLIALLLSTSAFAVDNFSATAERQTKTPYAYAITRESLDFHKALESSVQSERDALVEEIKNDLILHQNILNFENLNSLEQEATLLKVFALETKNYPLAPELILGPGPKGQEAFFDFDLKAQSPGKVYIDYKRLAAEDHPYASLLLLIHEVRHSAQLQLGFSTRSAEARGYAAAFSAQKAVFDQNEKITYCDFMSLLNEYEAFQFANYVVNRLTEGKVNIKGMGTIASQYDEEGKLLLDLPKLMHDHQENEWFERFNALVK